MTWHSIIPVEVQLHLQQLLSLLSGSDGHNICFSPFIYRPVRRPQRASLCDDTVSVSLSKVWNTNKNACEWNASDLMCKVLARNDYCRMTETNKRVPKKQTQVCKNLKNWPLDTPKESHPEKRWEWLSEALWERSHQPQPAGYNMIMNYSFAVFAAAEMQSTLQHLCSSSFTGMERNVPVIIITYYMNKHTATVLSELNVHRKLKFTRNKDMSANVSTCINTGALSSPTVFISLSLQNTSCHQQTQSALSTAALSSPFFFFFSSSGVWGLAGIKQTVRGEVLVQHKGCVICVCSLSQL